jgi:hypothetical protein
VHVRLDPLCRRCQSQPDGGSASGRPASARIPPKMVGDTDPSRSPGLVGLRDRVEAFGGTIENGEQAVDGFVSGLRQRAIDSGSPKRWKASSGDMPRACLPQARRCHSATRRLQGVAPRTRRGSVRSARREAAGRRGLESAVLGCAPSGTVSATFEHDWARGGAGPLGIATRPRRHEPARDSRRQRRPPNSQSCTSTLRNASSPIAPFRKSGTTASSPGACSATATPITPAPSGSVSVP